ncbi:hypothetical protein [Helicobacter pylori]|uniref:hypothetical protein n=1 Tax=Helicobacter pylori TaxID=210 RepID=UPI00111986C0|nr:hypothetical protein [Helicobacter pylori]
MQKEVLVEKPNPLTISYNLEQAISSLKSSVNALMKKEAHLDAYILFNIRNIVDELHKEVVLANQSNKNTPKRKRKSS